MIDQFMDDQMQALAQSYSGQDGAPLVQPLDPRNIDKWGAPIIQVWQADGHLSASSWPALALPLQTSTGFRELRLDGRRWRVYVMPSAQGTVQVVQSRDFRQSEKVQRALSAGLPLTLLIPLTAAVLWFAVRQSLRSLEAVARVAAKLDERNLVELPLQPVPVEIRPLVLSINKLLTRLREAFATQRRFVQDAAHELRTPITALSLQLENLRRHTSADATATEQVVQLDAGLRRAQRLVEQLLRLARNEAPQRETRTEPVDLAALLKESLTELMPLADRRRIDLGLSVQDAPKVHADRNDLRSLFDNLLDNALRYTPAGGTVDVHLHRQADALLVEIVDSGPGIPVDLRQRVFDRFFRAPGNDAEGSGLGLAIARSAAERNALRIELDNRPDGPGLLARVIFGSGALAA
jgi:two-component system OmpR family sensor kinase/two-component system sensor histidine kinase QseC